MTFVYGILKQTKQLRVWGIKIQRSRPEQLTESPRSKRGRAAPFRENIGFNQLEILGRIKVESR